MSKFHINKHGVPAPCKATKGNCPLGGASGNENHYNSMGEAQAAVDQENEAKYGLISGVTDAEESKPLIINLNSSNKDIDDLFLSEPYYNHGYVDVGIHGESLQEMGEYENNAVAKELWDSIPQHYKEEDKRNFTIIPERNMEAFFKSHVFDKSSQEDHEGNYVRMANEVRLRAPEYYNDEQIDYELEEDMSKFATKKTLQDSVVKVNGMNFMITDYEPRNWAKEYLDSGELNNFKSK